MLLVYSFLTQSIVGVKWQFTTAGWSGVFGFGRGGVILQTFIVACVTTAILLLVSLPTAYWVAKRIRRRSAMLVIMGAMTVPFFLSEDSRSVVWQALFANTGLVNRVLLDLGLVSHPVTSLLFTKLSLYLGFIPIYFANMMFPIWLVMQAIDDEYLEAARDLGASFFDLFVDVVLPLAAPGIIGGIIFTLVPILGDTVVPSILGGGQVVLVSSTLQSLVQVFEFPTAAAIAVLISVIAVVVVVLVSRGPRMRNAWAGMDR